MADEDVGQAWYEARLGEDKLRTDLDRVNASLKRTGQEGERAFATPLERATGRVAGGVRDIGLQLNSLTGRAPKELADQLDRAEREAEQALASIRQLAKADDLSPTQAQKYADALNEIQVEADQTVADLRELQRSDPRFDTAELQRAASLIDRVGDEASQTAGELDRMGKGDTHLSGVARRAKEAAGEFDEAGKKAGRFNGALGTIKATIVGLGVAFGLREAIGKMNEAVNAASTLAESTSKAQVVFGEFSDDVIEWGKDSATAFGQSNAAALEAAGTYGNLFQAFGIARPRAVEMSKTLVQLAADLASFNNTSVDEAIEALRSGISGETEPLKRYGVAINDVRLKEQALAMGLIRTSKGVLPVAVKAQAAYALILKDTALAQGDFARTSTGYANQQRILAAEAENLSAEIGEDLLPLWKDFIGFMRDPGIPIIRGVANVTRETFKIVGHAVDDLSDIFRRAQLYFGDLGKTVEDRANEIGVDVGEMKDHVEHAMNDMGLDIDAAMTYAEQRLKGLPDAMTDAGLNAIAAWKERDLAGEVGSSMDAAGQAATDSSMDTDVEAEVVRAATKARIAATQIPSEIAAGILEGRDQLVRAATDLATAATDPLVNEQRIQETREQLRELAEMTAEEIEAATPASEAARAAELAQLEIMLAGYLLRADPASQEAMGLLAKYAKAEDPATQQAYEKMVSAIEERAFILQRDVEEKSAATGKALPFVLSQERRNADNEARLTREAVKQHFDALAYDGEQGGTSMMNALHESISRNAYLAATATGEARALAEAQLLELQLLADSYGYNTASAYADGIARAARTRVYHEAATMGYGVRALLEANSPPGPASPLHDIDKWGERTFEAWGEGGVAALSGVRTRLTGQLAAIAAAVSGQAMAPAGGLSIGAGAGTGSAGNAGAVERHVHIHAEQGYDILRNEDDTVRAVQRGVWLEESMGMAGG